MPYPSRKEELVRRIEQSRRLSKSANDPLTTGRLVELTDELVKEQLQQEEKDGK